MLLTCKRKCYNSPSFRNNSFEHNFYLLKNFSWYWKSYQAILCHWFLLYPWKKARVFSDVCRSYRKDQWHEMVLYQYYNWMSRQSYSMNNHCFHHIETSQLISFANQLTGFYIMETYNNVLHINEYKTNMIGLASKVISWGLF